METSSTSTTPLNNPRSARLARLRRLVVGVAGLSAIAFSLATPLFSGTPALANPHHFFVTTTDDRPDGNPGDGVCATAAPVKCTLRAAIQESNALGGDYIVDLPAGAYRLTRIGDGEDAAAWGDLDITAPIEVSGAGVGLVTIDGITKDRIFDIHANHVSIHDLSVENGYTYRSNGGCIRINDGADLVLTSVYIKECTAEEGFGGGITNNGVAWLRYTAVDLARALSGGAVFNSNTMSVSSGGFGNSDAVGRPEVSGDFGLGGGILNKGQLDMTDTSVFKNTAQQSGGGMATLRWSSTQVERSSFTGNSASHFGGGIHAPGIVDLRNITISDNEAQNAGGIWVWGEGSKIRNSTIAFNRALVAAGGGYGGGMEGASYDFPVELTNSIVADNSGMADAKECFGNVTSYGYNLFFGSVAGCNLSTAMGDIFDTNPRLAALNYNGANTLSHALQSGSPARDAGADWDCMPEDQRSHPRPQGAHCDIGSIEMPAFTVILPIDPSAFIVRP